jgi:hypothetical protein
MKICDYCNREVPSVRRHGGTFPWWICSGCESKRPLSVSPYSTKRWAVQRELPGGECRTVRYALTKHGGLESAAALRAEQGCNAWVFDNVMGERCFR